MELVIIGLNGGQGFRRFLVKGVIQELILGHKGTYYTLNKYIFLCLMMMRLEKKKGLKNWPFLLKRLPNYHSR